MTRCKMSDKEARTGGQSNRQQIALTFFAICIVQTFMLNNELKYISLLLEFGNQMIVKAQSAWNANTPTNVLRCIKGSIAFFFILFLFYLFL